VKRQVSPLLPPPAESDPGEAVRDALAQTLAAVADLTRARAREVMEALGGPVLDPSLDAEAFERHYRLHASTINTAAMSVTTCVLEQREGSVPQPRAFMWQSGYSLTGRVGVRFDVHCTPATEVARRQDPA
jgi:hypothetical protein